MKENLTLSLERDLVRKIRIIAAKRATSVCDLINAELARLIVEAEYPSPERSTLAALDLGFTAAPRRNRASRRAS